MIIFDIVGYLFLFLIFDLYLSISICFKGKKAFEKAGENKKTASILLYNLYVIFKISHLPLYYFVVMFIPILNIYAIYKVMKGVNQVFHGPAGFAKKLFLLPFKYLPKLSEDEFEYFIELEDVSEEIEDDSKYIFKETSKNLNEQTKIEVDDVEEEEISAVDSIYKTKSQMRDSVAPYKAGQRKKQNVYYDEDDK